MLTELQLHQYRGFQKFTLQALKRVNLLVGKNNCGKTAILEAVRLLYGGVDPRLAASKIALEREEYIEDKEGNTLFRLASGGPDKIPNFSQFFYGRQILTNIELKIEGYSGKKTSSLSWKMINPLEEKSTEWIESLDDLVDFSEELFTDGELLLISKYQSSKKSIQKNVIALSSQGLLIDSSNGFQKKLTVRNAIKQIQEKAHPNKQNTLLVLPTKGLEKKLLLELWDEITRSGAEQLVIESLQLIDENIDGIFPLQSTGLFVLNDRGMKSRVPLGSYGDGVRRMFQLAIALVSAKGGTLLIDEIDTGLHYSLLPDMLRLVIATAERLNVQVFATTHSKDCVEGICEAAGPQDNQTENTLNSLVAIHGIKKNLERAIVYSGDELLAILSADIEVR